MRNQLLSHLLAVVLCWPCAGVADDLPLAAGEVVSVSVYGREDLSGERVIDAGGRLLVPLLGRLAAADVSPEVLEGRISAALMDAGLMEDAQVQVAVVRRRDVYVDGDVMVPGAYAWHAGLTVGQAVTLSGGMRRVAADSLGATLQAFGAVERFAALQLQVAGLQVQEARLRAEMAFAAVVFDPAVAVDAGALNRVALGEELNVVRFRDLQLAGGLGDLIVYPAAILGDPATAPLRQAQNDVMQLQAGLWLAEYNSLLLQQRALQEKARTLGDRRTVIDALVVTMQDRLNTLLILRDDGLVRASDVQDMQTAYSTLVTTQLQLLGDIADTQIALEEQGLVINSYAATLRRETGVALAVVVAARVEAAARLPDAERAAALAQSYQAGDVAAGAVRYQIRRGAADWQDVQAVDAVLPGDAVMVAAF